MLQQMVMFFWLGGGVVFVASNDPWPFFSLFCEEPPPQKKKYLLPMQTPKMLWKHTHTHLVARAIRNAIRANRANRYAGITPLSAHTHTHKEFLKHQRKNKAKTSPQKARKFFLRQASLQASSLKFKETVQKRHDPLQGSFNEGLIHDAEQALAECVLTLS